MGLLKYCISPFYIEIQLQFSTVQGRACKCAALRYKHEVPPVFWLITCTGLLQAWMRVTRRGDITSNWPSEHLGIQKDAVIFTGLPNWMTSPNRIVISDQRQSLLPPVPRCKGVDRLLAMTTKTLLHYYQQQCNPLD